jgi:hypothetical protein
MRVDGRQRAVKVHLVVLRRAKEPAEPVFVWRVSPCVLQNLLGSAWCVGL